MQGDQQLNGKNLASPTRFVSADWSKNPRKRSVYLADCGTRRIERSACPGVCWDVDALLELARRHSRDGPVLVGIDVVLGVPAGYWRLVQESGHAQATETFADWLGGLDLSGGFFETVVDTDEWRVERPWYKVAAGAGGLNSFTSKVDGGMLRRIDEATRAKPVFAVAGIPGVVGGGTREFWKQLAPHLSSDRDFAIWPFEGDMNSLLADRGVVLCETYPAIAYAAALADDLPTVRISNSKKKRAWRDGVCDSLAQAEWVAENRIDLDEMDAPRANEDDFDAYVTAAAVLRCIHEGMAMACLEWIDAKVEGSMLLTGVVDPGRKK